ncbi:hypothetical protein ACL9RF_06925 [Sphingobacterium sp. Mn56C]
MDSSMKGFEIKINNNLKKIAATSAGSVLVTLTYQHGIDITGSDDESGETFQWTKSDFNIGDIVEIKPKHVLSICDSTVSKKIDREELLTTYNNLKQFLIKEGRLNNENDRNKI